MKYMQMMNLFIHHINHMWLYLNMIVNQIRDLLYLLIKIIFLYQIINIMLHIQVLILYFIHHNIILNQSIIINI
jgi:hypothetical protein